MISTRIPSWRIAVVLIVLVVTMTACESNSRRHDRATPAEAAGMKLYAEGKYKEAITSFRETAYEDEKSYRSLLGIALCYAFLGEQAQFEAYALEASSRAPFAVEVHLKLGAMYIRGAERFRRHPAKIRYAEVGIEYLRRVFAVDPKAPELATNLGMGLYLAENYEGAVVFLKEAHAKNPERQDVLQVYLQVLRTLKNKPEVEALLEPLVKQGRLPDAWKSHWEWCQRAKK